MLSDQLHALVVLALEVEANQEPLALGRAGRSRLDDGHALEAAGQKERRSRHAPPDAVGDLAYEGATFGQERERGPALSPEGVGAQHLPRPRGRGLVVPAVLLHAIANHQRRRTSSVSQLPLHQPLVVLQCLTLQISSIHVTHLQLVQRPGCTCRAEILDSRRALPFPFDDPSVVDFRLEPPQDVVAEAATPSIQVHELDILRRVQNAAPGARKVVEQLGDVSQLEGSSRREPQAGDHEAAESVSKKCRVGLDSSLQTRARLQKVDDDVCAAYLGLGHLQRSLALYDPV
eukprot:3798543-Rhodomonas_salina.1